MAIKAGVTYTLAKDENTGSQKESTPKSVPDEGSLVLGRNM